MNVNNLSWEQIKELAEMAIKNGSDFSLTLCKDGDCSVDISKHDYRITPITTTTPNITWSKPLTPIPTVKIGDPPNDSDYGAGIHS